MVSSNRKLTAQPKSDVDLQSPYRQERDMRSKSMGMLASILVIALAACGSDGDCGRGEDSAKTVALRKPCGLPRYLAPPCLSAPKV